MIIGDNNGMILRRKGMKNYEKYADKIREYEGGKFCVGFILPNILKSKDCDSMSCDKCRMLQMVWLMEEYEEPKVDWSRVEVDTPILVRNTEDEGWTRRHFAKYEGGIVYAWKDSYTSWTAYNDKDVTAWRHTKLAECEED